MSRHLPSFLKQHVENSSCRVGTFASEARPFDIDICLLPMQYPGTGQSPVRREDRPAIDAGQLASALYALLYAHGMRGPRLERLLKVCFSPEVSLSGVNGYRGGEVKPAGGC